jgi:hypothetical protein
MSIFKKRGEKQSGLGVLSAATANIVRPNSSSDKGLINIELLKQVKEYSSRP